MPAGLIAAGASVIGGIGSIMGSKKKGPSLSQQYKWATRPMYTQYSSIHENRGDRGGFAEGGWQPGYVSIDPTIREIRRQTLENLPMYRSAITGGLESFNTSLGGIEAKLKSNANPFAMARVNPILERTAIGRGELSRGLARRGIFGPLAGDAMSRYDIDASRAEADARALAENDTLNALLGLNTQRFNAALTAVQGFQSLDAAQQQVAAQDLQQELAALGLSAPDIGSAIQAAGLDMRAQQLQDEQRGRGLYVLSQGLEGLENYFKDTPEASSFSWLSDPANLSALRSYYG